MYTTYQLDGLKTGHTVPHVLQYSARCAFSLLLIGELFPTSPTLNSTPGYAPAVGEIAGKSHNSYVHKGQWNMNQHHYSFCIIIMN